MCECQDVYCNCCGKTMICDSCIGGYCEPI